MRRRKQKHLRRALRFYKINHGFRAPFKVLVDGNFVNAILTLKYVLDIVDMHALHSCIVLDRQPVAWHMWREMHVSHLNRFIVLQRYLCRRGDVEDLVPQFLGEKSRILITRCCLEELRKLGSEVSGMSSRLQRV
jgi:rRNA-processing protein FCF1